MAEDCPGGDLDHPKNISVEEAAVMPGLDGWLASLFDDEHVDDTYAVLAGAPEPDPVAERRESDLRSLSAMAARRRANYRTLLDAEDGVTAAADWIAGTQWERKALERQLGQRVPGGGLTPTQVKAMVKSLWNSVDVLADAEPAGRSELHNQLGISQRYDPAGMVSVQVHPHGVTVRVGGGT